jgi:hypothetical protein
MLMLIFEFASLSRVIIFSLALGYYGSIVRRLLGVSYYIYERKNRGKRGMDWIVINRLYEYSHMHTPTTITPSTPTYPPPLPHKLRKHPFRRSSLPLTSPKQHQQPLRLPRIKRKRYHLINLPRIRQQNLLNLPAAGPGTRVYSQERVD